MHDYVTMDSFANDYYLKISSKAIFISQVLWPFFK
jgi:hypothetical protein